VLARGAAGSMRSSGDPVLRRLHESNTPDLALSCPPSEGMLLGNVRPRQFPPGRAMLLTRRQHQVLQTALVEGGSHRGAGRDLTEVPAEVSLRGQAERAQPAKESH
jgi:S-DNA-T family DNA segregation ATPase FtsK/SpoIIIE